VLRYNKNSVELPWYNAGRKTAAAGATAGLGVQRVSGWQAVQPDIINCREVAREAADWMLARLS